MKGSFGFSVKSAFSWKEKAQHGPRSGKVTGGFALHLVWTLVEVCADDMVDKINKRIQFYIKGFYDTSAIPLQTL